MLLILAAVAFLLVTFGVTALGTVQLLPLGLALFALGVLFPWLPALPARRAG